MKSTHKVEVVEVKLHPHPNADRLSIVDVFGGYPCIVRTQDWRDGNLGAYIPPDSVVDVSRPEFAFLAHKERTHHRVRCVKLRGVMSFGLLIKAPDGAKVGDDVAEYFGVTHYDPDVVHSDGRPKGPCTGGYGIQAPQALASLARYDVDALRRYRHLFDQGEMVWITEKIHGANARYAWVDDKMWCGSRSEWKAPNTNSIWWRALTDEMEALCKQFPAHVLYGEVYGAVQSLRYGLKNEVKFAAFDILDDSYQFVDPVAAARVLDIYGIPRVPFLACVPYDFDLVCKFAEGPSLIPGANHLREGCVVKPLHDRWNQTVGRVQLKVVSAEFLAKDDAA